MTIEVTRTFKERLADFVLMALLFMACAFALGYMHEHETQQREKAQFDLGYRLGKKQAETDADHIKIDAATIALQWWAGTADMKEVRQRLCTNVAPNALKGKK